MSSSERTTAARMAADPIALEAVRSVAALFDELERAGGGPVHPRSPHRRPASYRPAGARTGGVRTVPLRSVQPAPMARPAPGALPARQAAPQPVHATGLLHTVIRRAALWGAGPQGEHLAWRPARPARRASRREPSRSPRRRPDGTPTSGRDCGTWSAGSPSGAPAREASTSPGAAPAAPGRSSREADRPVVLREMPSTPTDPARGAFPRCGAVSPRSGIDRIAGDAAGPSWSSGRPRRKTARTP